MEEKIKNELTLALSTEVIESLLVNGDGFSRLDEKEEIIDYLSKKNLSAIQSYELICALGQIDPEAFPISKCIRFLEAGISAENIVGAIESCVKLDEESMSLALSAFRELSTGDMGKSDIEFRVKEIFGNKYSENDMQSFLATTSEMISEGKLCYPESLASFNSEMMQDRMQDYDYEQDDEY